MGNIEISFKKPQIWRKYCWRMYCWVMHEFQSYGILGLFKSRKENNHYYFFILPFTLYCVTFHPTANFTLSTSSIYTAQWENASLIFITIFSQVTYAIYIFFPFFSTALFSPCHYLLWCPSMWFSHQGSKVLLDCVESLRC